MDSFAQTIRRAEGEFRFRHEQALIVLLSLRKALVWLIGLAVLVCAVETVNLLKLPAPRSVLANVAVGLLDVIGLFAGAAITMLLVYSVHWHFSLRLARRRNNWQHFVSRTLDK